MSRVACGLVVKIQLRQRPPCSRETLFLRLSTSMSVYVSPSVFAAYTKSVRSGYAGPVRERVCVLTALYYGFVHELGLRSAQYVVPSVACMVKYLSWRARWFVFDRLTTCMIPMHVRCVDGCGERTHADMHIHKCMFRCTSQVQTAS